MQPEQLPDIDAAIEAWNSRAQSVETLYGNGIFQLNWVDESGGRHADQGDIDLWYQQPDMIALRCSKFGDTISLFGSDGRMQWFYDAVDDVLYEGEIVPGQMLLIADQPFSPALLLDVLGLHPVPERGWRSLPSSRQHEYIEASVPLYGMGPANDSEAAWPRPEMWWWFESDGVDWPVSRTFMLMDEVRMQVEDDPGRRRTLRLPDQPITSWPRMAGSIRMQMLEGAALRRTTSSQIEFDELTIDVDGEPMDRVFDLVQLRDALQPGEVRQLVPDSDAEASR